MAEIIKPFAEFCVLIIEVIGIGLVAIFAVYSLFILLSCFSKGRGIHSVTTDARQKLGRGILVGLEFLVAADIIQTVAVDLNLRTVGTLFLIVLIRTFLSFTLEVELTGDWPWQNEDME